MWFMDFEKRSLSGRHDEACFKSTALVRGREAARRVGHVARARFPLKRLMAPRLFGGPNQRKRYYGRLYQSL